MNELEIRGELKLKLDKNLMLLYPQYDSNLEISISKETFEELQKEAALRLTEAVFVDPEVAKHWQSIVDGNIPFGYKIKG